MVLLLNKQYPFSHPNQTKWIALILLATLLFMKTSLAGEREDRRVWAGVDLFPSLLAADLDIKSKQASSGELLLVLLYSDDKAAAEQMAIYLSEIKKIRGIPILIEVSDDVALKEYSQRVPAGIFLTQRIVEPLDPIIQYGKEHHILVFSPFEGDVKEGIAAGIMIRDRIRPYVNIKSLASSGIRLKEFFLRISEQYDR